MAYPYSFPNYGAFPAYNPQNFAPVPVSSPTPPQNASGGVNGQPGFVCRPVTSRLEAEAVQVDFLGPGTIMPDLAHGVIYLKRFNPGTGASDFSVFSMETEQDAAVQYATIEDVNALKAEIEAMKKAKKVVKRSEEYEDD